MPDQAAFQNRHEEETVQSALYVRSCLDQNHQEDLKAHVLGLHTADCADLLEQLDETHRWQVLELCKKEIDPEVFAHLRSSVRLECFERLSPKLVAGFIAALESDDALDLIQDLEDETRQKVLSHLSAKVRAVVEQGLTFPEDSAGRLIQREVAAFPQFWTVGKTLDYFRVAGTDDMPEDFYTICIVDPLYHVIGILPVSRILRETRTAKLVEVMNTEFHTIPAHMDQEDAAFLFRQYGLVSAPVVDESGRLLGVITVDDMVDVISEEAEEDLLKLGGVQESDLFQASIDTTRARFSWLAINLVTAIFASLVISMFQASIDQLVALAVLMPIVASMGGNAGTQTLTVAVRSLATRELSRANALRIIRKETLVGAMNGVLFAILIAAVTIVWFHNIMLGVIIGVAMMINMVVAGLFGALIPLGLEKLRLDPALASSIFLTTITDTIGFCTFLGLASLMLL